ncbi:MAG TPA: CocE/NonD family hydrolase, partial [Vicinamibacteria bacterium]|nr:CocE/NonD family hydrolase [Vicinamibacteria bacterium]
MTRSIPGDGLPDASCPFPRARLYAPWLFLVLGLFCLRVVGQLIVAIFEVGFLPPMEEWYSGLIPYPFLFGAQLVIIGLFAIVYSQFVRGRGWLVHPRVRLGDSLVVFGALYLTVMVLRYTLRMALYPPERWVGGSIPIFFHWVLASFILLVGHYHRRGRTERRTVTRRGRLLRAFAASVAVAGIAAWVAYLLAPAWLARRLGSGPPMYSVRIHRSLPLTTSDDVRLVGDLYLPRRAGPTPTILVRIPYSKTLQNELFATLIGRMWAEHGYSVFIQGTRGRYESGGRYEPFVNERRDGIETLAWLAEQPWFDGRLGMWGGSYFGYTQWVLADQTDPGPSALFVQIASSSFYDMFYQGGAFALESALYWALRSHGPVDVPVSSEQLDRGYGAVPLRETDDRAGADVSFFNDWVTHPERDAYWQHVDGENRTATLRAPVLLMAGWFDPFLPSQLGDFLRIRAEASPQVAEKTRLIIGPWSHAAAPPLPDGYQPRNYRLESLAPTLSWFDRHLKGETTEPELPPIRLFVIGDNVWRDEQEWPLARTRFTAYFLDRGDGRSVLSSETPAASGHSTYIFDPTDPVRTQGGAMLGPRAGMREQARTVRDD